MFESSEDNEIYNDVIFIEDNKPYESLPQNPPRKFVFKNEDRKIKPPRKMHSPQNQQDDKDLVYLTLNLRSNDSIHLTKHRAKPPEKTIPGSLVKSPSSHSNKGENCKPIIDTAIEYIKARREQSMTEFSRTRRTAVKIKPIKKSL